MKKTDNMSRRQVFATGAAATAALSMPAILRAQTVNIRLHHFNSPLAIAHKKFLVPWADRVREQSDGAINIEIFPSMQLGGKPGELYSQVKDGIVDMVWTIPGYTANRFPLTEVFELPFVSGIAAATAPAVHEFAQKHMGEEYSDTHPVLFHSHPPGNFHTANKQIKTLEDMQGLLLRAPSRAITEALGTMGAVPVSMPVPRLVEAVSRGVVEGAALPWGISRPIRLHEVTKFHTVAEFYCLPFALIMNKNVWEGMPSELQQVINDNSTSEFVQTLGQYWDADETSGRQAAIDAGNTIYELPADERARWKEACNPVIENWIAKVNDLGQDGQALYDDALALIAKYSA
jgi:TRAP-type C4-dicarboxylate transport system substrate-binding protein